VIDLPYRSQRNNFFNPDGACNVTCLAMCLLHQGAQRRDPDRFPQFEDELYNHAIIHGYDRHDGYGLTYISQDYGVAHSFSREGTIEQLRSALDDGKPCILHGYFTSFGHIIAVRGYEAAGLRVHDPYGEWHSWGYDLNEPDGHNTKGKNQLYSWGLIKETCMPDGFLWLHVLG
jgi:hypothetical protein